MSVFLHDKSCSPQGFFLDNLLISEIQSLDLFLRWMISFSPSPPINSYHDYFCGI